MICVRVPLDLHAVACSGSSAFAFGTPISVGSLISLAVREAIGERAPRDKYMRCLRVTLAGLTSGRFTVDVDGRRFEDPKDVVVCEGTARVRFFLPGRLENRRQPSLPLQHQLSE